MVFVNLAPGHIGGAVAVQINVVGLAVVFHRIRGVCVQLAARKIVIVAVGTATKGVAACAACQLVVADAAIKRVVAGIAIKHIIIAITIHRLDTAAARMTVVIAPEDVVPLATMQGVAAVLTDDEVVPIAAVEEILRATACGAVLFLVFMPERGVDRVIPFVTQNADRPVGEVCGQAGGILVAGQLPAVAGKGVIPGRVAGHPFLYLGGDDGRAAGPVRRSVPHRDILSRTVKYPLHLHIGAHHTVAENNIVAGTADDRIATLAALQEILIDAAEKLIVSFAAEHPVTLLRDNDIALLQMAFLLIGIEHIIPGHAVDEVPATAAGDDIAVLLLVLFAAPVLARQDKRAAVQNIGISAAVDPVARKTAEDRIIACTGLRDQGITRLARLQRPGLNTVARIGAHDAETAGGIEGKHILLAGNAADNGRIPRLGRYRRGGLRLPPVFLDKKPQIPVLPVLNIGKRLVAAVLQHGNLPAVIHQIAETEALVVRVITAARLEHQFVISRAVHLQQTLAVGIKNRALIAVAAGEHIRILPQVAFQIIPAALAVEHIILIAAVQMILVRTAAQRITLVRFAEYDTVEILPRLVLSGGNLPAFRIADKKMGAEIDIRPLPACDIAHLRRRQRLLPVLQIARLQQQHRRAVAQIRRSHPLRMLRIPERQRAVRIIGGHIRTGGNHGSQMPQGMAVSHIPLCLPHQLVHRHLAVAQHDLLLRQRGGNLRGTAILAEDLLTQMIKQRLLPRGIQRMRELPQTLRERLAVQTGGNRVR